MVDKIISIHECVKRENPLIHCITNPISINQCANVILSVGARPIMAEHPKEVREITETADSLLLNTGNITDARMESIMLSAEVAHKRKIPVLTDVVGIACSGLRRSFVFDLFNRYVPSVIKGNYSEIRALDDEKFFSPGVDADGTSDRCIITETAEKLALKYQTVILATGRTDVVTDGKRTVYINNGTPKLATVTGTGCMLGALCSVFMTCSDALIASLAACCHLGISGELAKTESGNGSFMVNLLDRISTLGRCEISKYINVEIKQNEKS